MPPKICDDNDELFDDDEDELLNEFEEAIIAGLDNYSFEESDELVDSEDELD